MTVTLACLCEQASGESIPSENQCSYTTELTSVASSQKQLWPSCLTENSAAFWRQAYHQRRLPIFIFRVHIGSSFNEQTGHTPVPWDRADSHEWGPARANVHHVYLWGHRESGSESHLSCLKQRSLETRVPCRNSPSLDLSLSRLGEGSPGLC